MLIFEVEGTFVYLFPSLGIFKCLFFSLGREDLDLGGLFLRERKFDLMESLSLGSDSFLLRNDFFSLVGIPQNKGGQGSIYRYIPLFTIGSNIDLYFLLGL